MARFLDSLLEIYETNKQTNREKILFKILNIFKSSELLQLSSLYNSQYLEFIWTVTAIIFHKDE